MHRIRVAICDDDGLIRDGLGAILETLPDMELVGTAADGEEIIDLSRTARPEVVLMDIRMHGIDGVTATQHIKAEHPTVKVIMLTTFHDAEYVRSAITMGAEGYMLKSSPAEVIVESIRTVYRGTTVLQADVARTLGELLTDRRQEPSAANRFEAMGLAPREREILALIAEGLSNKEIAAKLSLSDGTVRNYISEMLLKTGARDRTQLAILYYRTL